MRSSPILAKPLLANAMVAGCLLLVAGCSQAPTSEGTANTDAASSATQEVAPSTAPLTEGGEATADRGEAPGFTSSAAPGVAFAYRYAFSLPGDAISDVQHRHAAACEELGQERCQVTGMDFHQDGAGTISARLDLMVAPSLAHRFGKQALDAVRAADGTLANAAITGDDVGGQIEASQLRSAGFEAELARIEARLASAGLSSQERTALAARATELRDGLRGEQDSRMAGEQRLATTPISFAYASHGLFSPGKDPLGQAAASSLTSLEGMLAVILTVAGLLLPWLLLGGLLVLAWKGLRRNAPSAAISDSSGPLA
jgi:Domain of unknown function (DUF4349)